MGAGEWACWGLKRGRGGGRALKVASGPEVGAEKWARWGPERWAVGGVGGGGGGGGGGGWGRACAGAP